ncbi:MAG: sulfotransferase domain-containing protein [Candidatus Thiodiazotropha endolucinida]|nr:sulfotransferase domain-containing protein [Candidatus Thiodiazotropha endolucinida]
MAAIQNKGLDVLFRHIKKKLRITLKNIQHIIRRDALSRHPVIINSIPKSGTHMLEDMLDEIPGLRYVGCKTLSSWDNIESRHLKKIAKQKKGTVLLGHLTALPSVINEINKNETKVILLIRDPRDVVVSFVNYVMYIDKTHMAHEYLNSFDSDRERIDAAIEGNKPGVPNLGTLLNQYEGWSSLESVLVCRYEDLLSEAHGGSESKQKETIKRILSHLQINEYHDVISSMIKRLEYQKSSTFFKGGSGKWMGILTPEQKNKIKEYAGSWLMKYGYENDLEW